MTDVVILQKSSTSVGADCVWARRSAQAEGVMSNSGSEVTLIYLEH